MGKVIEIAISQSLKGKMESVNSIQVIAGEGIIKDRHLKKNSKLLIRRFVVRLSLEAV